MNIQINETLRINATDALNLMVEQLKEVTKDKDKETERTEIEWVTVPNFYTSSIKRAVTKCVEIIVEQQYKENYKNIDEYLSRQESILKNIEKQFKKING